MTNETDALEAAAFAFVEASERWAALPVDLRARMEDLIAKIREHAKETRTRDEMEAFARIVGELQLAAYDFVVARRALQ